jgi:hypothetical protein
MLLDGIRVVGLMLAVLRFGAQGAVFTQEGPNTWTNTVNGEMSAVPHGRLIVIARGRIIVHGIAAEGISYKLTQRVRAGSEAEARQLLGGGQIAPQTVGRVMRLEVQQNSSINVGNELTINVPRNLAAVHVESQFLGNIDAFDLDGGLEAQTPVGDIHADRIGGYAYVNAGNGRILLGKIGGLVQCFAGAGSITVENAAGGVKHCQTGGGELLVKEAGAAVVLDNEGGNITVNKAAASVEAHATSGIIRVEQAGGQVVADTRGGGSIQIGSARGIKAESAQGTVRVRGASGPLAVSTALGSILAELAAGAPLQDSVLAAASGDITVLIPSNFPVSVMVTGDMGAYSKFVSDFPEIRSTSVGFARAPVVAEGAINGGGPMLHINAGTGVVYLRRIR